MRPHVAPVHPFEPSATRDVVAGRLEVCLRAGEHYDDIAATSDVRFGAARAASRLDGGAVDRTLRKFSAGFRVARAYSSRVGWSRPGLGHEGWDDLEHRVGLSRTFQIEVDPECDVLGLVAELRELGAVEQACLHYVCEAPFGASQAGPGDPTVFDRVGAGAALAMEGGDAAVIVAVIDSGVVPDHPELQGRLRTGADTVDLVQQLLSRTIRFQGRYGRDIRDTRDDLGHGTGCAGIVAAKGVAVPPGIGGAAQVLPLRALARAHKPGRPEATAVGAIPDINAAVKLAVDLGAKVLNLSFGTPASSLRKDDPIPHAAVVDYAVERGAIPIAASGNRGDESQYYPACLPSVIAVGSCDAAGRPSRFTTRGRHVALCAPGERIPCAGLNGYQENTGTSFAAPFVAGAAALLVARAHRSAMPVDVHSVRDVLTRGAAPFARRDAQGCGAGVLDVPAALRLLDESGRGPPELRLLSGVPASRKNQSNPTSQEGAVR